MRHILYLLLIIGLASVNQASATTWEIDDTYIGGGYQDNYAQGEDDMKGDVISTVDDYDAFNIGGMTVDIDSDGNVTITIVTDYKVGDSGYGLYGTEYGDLFISIDGWDQNLTSTYTTTETGWEYVFDTDTGNIYSLSGLDKESDAYLLSGDFFGSDGSVAHYYDSWYRTDQLVQVDADALDPDTLLSTEGIFNDGTLGLLIYTFNLADLGLDSTQSYELAFRWAMTCANDVIEGSVSYQPVPEPETMVLLGLGLLGLGAVGRRKLAPVRIRPKKKRG